MQNDDTNNQDQDDREIRGTVTIKCRCGVGRVVYLDKEDFQIHKETLDVYFKDSKGKPTVAFSLKERISLLSEDQKI